MRSVMMAVIVLVLSLQGFSATKKLLIEDFTGAWCPMCPTGAIELEKWRVKHPNNIIGITQHTDGGTPLKPDSMENFYSRELHDTMLGPTIGVPALSVNRMFGSIQKYVDSLNIPSPVAVGIIHTWESRTRKITGTVTAKFESAVNPGDLRIGMMIVEHNVVGVGPGYDQRNGYDTSPTYPELKGAGDPIVGYKHYMVCRDSGFGGTFGKAGIIPNNPVVGTTYSTPFTYTVPAQYNSLDVILDNLYLVAFVGYGKYKVPGRMSILNSEKAKVIATQTAVGQGPNSAGMADKNYRLKSFGSTVYLETPTVGVFTIEFFSLSGAKVATLADARLAAGTHRFSVLNKNIRNGMYIVKVSNGVHLSIGKISLAE